MTSLERNGAKFQKNLNTLCFQKDIVHSLVSKSHFQNAKTHFQKGETHFQNAETHFPSAETHFPNC